MLYISCQPLVLWLLVTCVSPCPLRVVFAREPRKTDNFGSSEDASGLGKDMWNLTPEQISTVLKVIISPHPSYPNRITQKTNYGTQEFIAFIPVYAFGLAAIKASFLFFYLRIFPDKKFRVHVLVALSLNVLLGFIYILINVLQCIPLDVIWNEWDKDTHDAKCIDMNAVAWTHGAFNIALDVWILVLPLRQIKFLKLSWRKKLGIMLMFGVGIL